MIPCFVKGALKRQEPKEWPTMRSFVEDYERKVNEQVGSKSLLHFYAGNLFWSLDEYETAVTNHGLNKPETELAYKTRRETIRSISVAMSVTNNSYMNAPMQAILDEDACCEAKLPENHEDIIDLSVVHSNLNQRLMMPRVVEGALEHQELDMLKSVEHFERKINELVGTNTLPESEVAPLFQMLNEYANAVTNHGLNKPATELAYLSLCDMISAASDTVADRLAIKHSTMILDNNIDTLPLGQGFRLRPTDDELVTLYLCRKCALLPISAPIVTELDLYKFDPWQLPDMALYREKEWYFFLPGHWKYLKGSRPNRAAGTSYWKATRVDTPIGKPKSVAIKKSLVFFSGKAPREVKTNWIMHENYLVNVDRFAGKRNNNLRVYTSENLISAASDTVADRLTIKHSTMILDNNTDTYSQQNAHMQPISDQDAYWKDNLTKNYEDIIRLSKYDLQWEEDMYNTFCRGFPLNDGEKWFCIDTDGKICLTVSAREALEGGNWEYMYLADSRFEEVAEYCNLPKFRILSKFRSKLLSPETTYGVYLVYKLPEGYKYGNPPPVQVVDKNSHPKEVHSIFLQTPRTPVISSNAMNQGFNPSNIRGLPKLRSDGWMEVQVHEFQTRPTIKMVSTHLSISSYDMGLQGLTVQCLEFRPV